MSTTASDKNANKNAPKKERHPWSRRLLRWGILVALVVGALWLATWLAQRSLRTPKNLRGMQSWLDDNLNADVSLLGDMVVRLNLVRRSRLLFHDVEIEHPNPTFPGKFAVIERMGAWTPMWSLAKVWPGSLELRFQNPMVSVEENEYGEWSTDGIMKPLVSTDARFPFPIPRMSDWKAYVEDGVLSLRRRGYELKIDLDTEISGKPGSDHVVVRERKAPFSFGPVDSPEGQRGNIGPALLSLRLGKERGDMPQPVPGRCEVRVESFPAAALPFLFAGIPMENASGVFNGVVRYQTHPDAMGALAVEGEIRDAPLAVFGLPRNAPLRMLLPVEPAKTGLQAEMHMGPSGFGAFEIRVTLDEAGMPRLLSMRGDVAALDDVPALFTKYSSWPDWLSRTFNSVEWRSGRWLGFGWSGENLRLGMTRSTASLNLTGEAEMMGGRVRLAMTPDQEDSPVSIAAERLDPQLLAAKMSHLFPAPFRVQLTGSHANLTWHGFNAAGGRIDEWGAGLVFAKPIIDLASCGSWWRGLSGISRAVGRALPEWGGGDDFEFASLANKNTISLDQLSVVSEHEADGDLAVEFRAYGDAFGQATGMIEKRPDGMIEGEFFLAGSSALLAAAEKANPDLGNALALLAHDTMGMRVVFQMAPGKEPEFFYPFLADARRIHDELVREEEGARDAPMASESP